MIRTKDNNKHNKLIVFSQNTSKIKAALSKFSISLIGGLNDANNITLRLEE